MWLAGVRNNQLLSIVGGRLGVKRMNFQTRARYNESRSCNCKHETAREWSAGPAAADNEEFSDLMWMSGLAAE